MNVFRNRRGQRRKPQESPTRSAPRRPTTNDWQFFWEVIRAEPKLVFGRAGMEIPVPPPVRRAVRRRRARAREPRVRMRHGEADTTLPGPRWNLISASLRISCRQKTAEQNYYNWFSRIETVRSWFKSLRRHQDLSKDGCAASLRGIVAV